MIDYQKFETKRKDLHDQSSKSQLYGSIFIIVAIVFFIIAFSFELPFIIVFSIVAIVVGSVYFSKSSQAHKTFRDIVKGSIIKDLLDDVFEDVTYDHKNAINISRINETGMLKEPDRVQGEDYVKAKYKGVTIESSDFTLLERVVRRDAKGNQVVTYEPYFKGRWLIYRFNKVFKEVLKVSESRPYTRGLVKVETESILFNKKFSTFASSEQFAFYHITPLVLEKLMELEKLHKGTIMYCLCGDELHVGINDNRNYFELALKTPINENALKPLLTEIDLMAAIINELKLDSPKYNT